MNRKRVLFRIFSAVSMALLLLPAVHALAAGGVSPVRVLMASALAPVQVLVRDAGALVSDTLRGLRADRRTAGENELLRTRLAMDEVRLLEAERVFRENSALREQLGMERRYRSVTLCPARVLSAGEDIGGRVYTLDRGTADGVGPGCAVLTREGMAGRISAAGPDWSEMLPLSHRDFRAAVRLLFCDETGIAAGTGEALTLTFLPEDSRALPGDRVFTDSGAFPRGLPLGTLERVVLREDGLSCIGTVRAAAQFPPDRVFIVTDFAEGE